MFKFLLPLIAAFKGKGKENESNPGDDGANGQVACKKSKTGQSLIEQSKQLDQAIQEHMVQLNRETQIRVDRERIARLQYLESMVERGMEIIVASLDANTLKDSEMPAALTATKRKKKGTKSNKKRTRRNAY